MKLSLIDSLERAVTALIDAYQKEKEFNKELRVRIAELEAIVSREPDKMEALKGENRKLRRNAELAAQKIEELLERL